MQLTTSWHEKGRMEGRLEGRLEGELKETRAAVVEFLESRFGECPPEVAASLEGLEDLEKLRRLRREVFKANTLEEAVAAVHVARAQA